jgi:hypothetical protein
MRAMNRTLIALGVGIWGIMLILRFIFTNSLGNLKLNATQINDTLFPLTILEIVAFIIALVGILKND